MKTLLLSLGLIAALSVPAMAQSSYDDSAANVAAGGNSGIAASGTANDFTDQGVDATATGSISVTPAAGGETGNGLCDNGAGPTGNPQCLFFGGNNH